MAEPEQKTEPTVEKKTPTVLGTKTRIKLASHDSTLNALVDRDANILTCIQPIDWNRLLVQARATHGIKKGRYYFEMNVLQLNLSKEELDNGKGLEFRIGISKEESTWVGGKGSICFDHRYVAHADGDNRSKLCLPGHVPLIRQGAPPVLEDDVIGLEINLDMLTDMPHSVTLYINGDPVTSPELLPESMIEGSPAVYPHIAIRGGTVQTQFASAKIISPNDIPMIALAHPTHIVERRIPKSASRKGIKPQFIYPIGIKTSSVQEINQKWVDIWNEKNETYVDCSTRYLREWMAISDVPMKERTEYGLTCLDDGEHLSRWAKGRECHVIWSCTGLQIFPMVRKRDLSWFKNYEIIGHVLPFISNDSKQKKLFTKFDEAQCPKEDEGFDKLEFKENVEIFNKQLEQWKIDQRLHSKVPNLKSGPNFKIRLDNWHKFIKEKKTVKIGGKFMKEDWMIATLRFELINLLISFKEDVIERVSFPVSLLPYYYKLYRKTSALNLQLFNCTSVEELVIKICTPALKIENDFLASGFEWNSDEELLDRIFDQVNNEREKRLTMVWAGDEKSDLCFSAPLPPLLTPPKLANLKRIPAPIPNDPRSKIPKKEEKSAIVKAVSKALSKTSTVASPPLPVFTPKSIGAKAMTAGTVR